MEIREYIEQREKENLSSFAKLAIKSKGRAIFEPEDPIRTCFMRDRDRVIHSKAFRRLKHKTQVYISPGNDHFRTRLTHTLEVNQIAKTIGKGLRLNEDLIEAIALAHDVGHTPFAHSGEEVLNELMTDGFRHNENSVRVLTEVEQRSEGRGLNLSKEVLDGVLNHRGFDKDINRAETLEGQVVRLSDKVAYVQHDIDDSIRGGILRKCDLPKEPLEILGESHSARITTLVTDAIKHGFHELENSKEPKINLSPKIKKALIDLRTFMFEHIYNGEVCSKERESAMYVIEHLFKYYKKNPERLPLFYQTIAKTEGIERGVADYISGMSDNYCVTIFKELVIPRSFL
ncbi:dGTPase [Desulfonispora thiosulfatigenes DSM 11270]|uniref:Deoxyguanosinetriphosphate triphosphohydrolase-like protein n=1 Tax=Desulfonispora thiosulfatigenes DSM 11270 TaxID=656914 RepID=A0A1W1V961_DESTI|nr:deoxyguanosinetriphosphate triphosphohydrolase [Desulfonispora thiosulfatigenes]SMB89796.1 dGTPase [Desulfonispora thiosulfatigenes DSM 11270]